MAGARSVQLNIRSAFAQQRARDLARRMGVTVTQVVEDALRSYEPETGVEAPPGALWEGPLLVIAGRGGTISLAQAEDALLAVRDGAEDA